MGDVPERNQPQDRSRVEDALRSMFAEERLDEASIADTRDDAARDEMFVSNVKREIIESESGARSPSERLPYLKARDGEASGCDDADAHDRSSGTGVDMRIWASLSALAAAAALIAITVDHSSNGPDESDGPGSTTPTAANRGHTATRSEAGATEEGTYLGAGPDETGDKAEVFVFTGSIEWADIASGMDMYDVVVKTMETKRIDETGIIYRSGEPLAFPQWSPPTSLELPKRFLVEVFADGPGAESEPVWSRQYSLPD